MFYIFITYNIVSKKKNNQRAFEYKSIQRTVDLVTVNKKTILAQTPNVIYFPHKNSASLPNFHRILYLVCYIELAKVQIRYHSNSTNSSFCL